MLKRKKMTSEKQGGIADFLTNADNKSLLYLQAVLLIYVILLTFPPLIVDTRNDVDYSMYMGWYKAAKEGLVYGRDILFTYGPLGFLTAPIFIYEDLWVCSAIYMMAVYALVIFGCCLYIRKMKANLVKTVVFATIFAVVFRGWLNSRPSRDFELLLSILIFSYLYIRGKGKVIWLAGLAFLYSVLPFIKFSTTMAGAIAGAVLMFVLILDKRRKEAAAFLAAGLVSFGVLGLLLIGPPKAIFTYLYGCWQIVSGYSDAVGAAGANETRVADFSAAIFAWVSYLFLLCYYALREKRDELIYLVLCFGALFLSFKLGFVRRDYEHLVFFYSMWLAVFGLFFLRSFADAKIIRYFILLFIFVMLYQGRANISSFLWTPKGAANELKNLQLSFNLLRGIGAEEQESNVRQQLTQFFPLKDETVEMLSGRTMDVFPYDVAMTEAYGFKWHPRPVYLSYQAYTEYLDGLNAKHFSSESAPEYVLYALRSFDYRYAIFDEPATFRTLLQRYRPCAADGEFIVLQKNPSAVSETEKYIGERIGKLGKMIPLPAAGDGLLFARIHIECSPAGLICKALYKLPNVYIGFINEGGIINDRIYRFVFSNAMDGVFVSKYIISQNNLLALWQDNVKQDITGIAIWAEQPIFFKDKVTVQFFTIPTIKQPN